MNEMTVTVIEQPGALGAVKARTISDIIQRFYLNASPELRAEIDRRAEELREQKGVVSCPAGNMSADSSSCSLA